MLLPSNLQYTESSMAQLTLQRNLIIEKTEKGGEILREIGPIYKSFTHEIGTVSLNLPEIICLKKGTTLVRYLWQPRRK